jgi:hypothetical protein
MAYFHQIRDFIFRLLLSLKKKYPERNPVSLERAKTVGILFNAEDIPSNDSIVAFAQKLKSLQKEVQLLGYIPKRDFGFNYPFQFISDKDRNWYGKPKGDTTRYFMQNSFDLLINFCADECLPLEYISAVSPAKFRVGFDKAPENANYDLILIPKENKKISNLIQNLEKYLK